MTDRYRVCTLQEAVEMAASVAVITAMIANPGSGNVMSVDTYVEPAVRAFHVFFVLLVAIYVNISI